MYMITIVKREGRIYTSRHSRAGYWENFSYEYATSRWIWFWRH